MKLFQSSKYRSIVPVVVREINIKALPRTLWAEINFQSLGTIDSNIFEHMQNTVALSILFPYLVLYIHFCIKFQSSNSIIN